MFRVRCSPSVVPIPASRHGWTVLAALVLLGSGASSLAGPRPAAPDGQRTPVRAVSREAPRAADGAAAVPEGWLARVTEDLRRQEYRFSRVEPEVWSAPNRSQELRSRIGTSGIEVFPRETDDSGAGAAWKLELATASFGRSGDAWPLECLAISAEEARVELDHGLLVEWFENGERGIEQGWTIERRPAGIDPLEIGLAITGDLSLRLDEGGRSGVFVDARGEARLRYADLRAEDATGRALAARLVPTPEGVVVRVEDAGAVYPLRVDPLLTSPSWTVESNQEGAGFGYSVSTAGDVNGDGYSDVIVGAPFQDAGETGEGRAYVYLGNGGDGGLVRALQQRTRDDTRPISLLGKTAPSGLFHLRASFPKSLVCFAWASPAPKAWLEWELEPLGRPFDGIGIERGTPLSLVPAGGTLILDEPVFAARSGHALYVREGVFHWRARVATNNPLFPHTAWFSMPGNNVTESKLRKPAAELRY